MEYRMKQQFSISYHEMFLCPKIHSSELIPLGRKVNLSQFFVRFVGIPDRF